MKKFFVAGILALLICGICIFYFFDQLHMTTRIFIFLGTIVAVTCAVLRDIHNWRKKYDPRMFYEDDFEHE
jgi:hypothetical protein